MIDDSTDFRNVRIDIEWIFISPSLRVASGIIKVLTDEFCNLSTKVLFECSCEVKDGLRSFKAINEKPIPSKLFDKYEPYIKCMMLSYFEGMVLNKKQFFWIPESLNYSYPSDE